MVNVIFATLFVIFSLGLNANEDVDTLLNLRQSQSQAYGTTYTQLEAKVQALLQKHSATSSRSWWQHAIHRFSRLSLQILFILSVWFLIYAMYYFSAQWRLVGIFFTFLTGFLLSLSYYESRLSWGVIKASPASIYMGPDTRYPLCGTIGFLNEVTMIKKHQEWVLVGGHIRGWIRNQDIGYRE